MQPGQVRAGCTQHQRIEIESNAPSSSEASRHVRLSQVALVLLFSVYAELIWKSVVV